MEMLTTTQIKMKRVLILVASMTLSLMPLKNAHAFCDSCVAAAVGTAAASINVSITALNTTVNGQLVNIGNAIGSLHIANMGLLEKLSQVNQQGIKTLTYEHHELTSKVETLKIKRDINDLYGTISRDHCMDAELSAGALDTQTEEYQQSLQTVKLFSFEAKQATRSPALRRSILERHLPEGVDFGRYFSPSQTLTSEEMLHVPALAHILAQATVFPVAPESDSEQDNDRARHYRELKREQDTHVVIVEDAIARAMLMNAPVVDAGDYVSFALEEANVNPEPFVQDGKTSETALIKAIGLSNFGSSRAIHNSGLSGEELTRMLITEMGKSNFVLAKQYEALKDIRFVSALSYAKEIETFYAEKLADAYQRLN